MATNTLTSLAILKVNVDQGRDYLDYLRPFILQILVEYKPDPITDTVVSKHIRERFGLEIPERTVQIVLRRLAKTHVINRELGVYHITGNLPDPGIVAKQNEAKRHIDAVVADLIEFSSNSLKPFSSRDIAETAISAFLATFNVSCLRAYLRGTAIPDLADQRSSDIVLVSEYVIHLQKTNPERFDSFMIMVQGHMLANALLCPDLEHVTNNYKQVTFYLDTPLLIQYIGLEDRTRQVATTELLRLLRNLDGKICAFSHSRDELKGVLQGAATNLETPSGRGAIILEARRSGTTKSDLLLLAEQIDDQLSGAGIEITGTPRYIERFQIDESVFESVLKEEISYANPRAILHDMNSVRSIYVLRKGITPASLEKSLAVLVTSNNGFAQAAWNYEQQHEVHGGSREVASVISDFSLANLAWLKAPLGAPSLPSSEILALSYAALQPSIKLLDEYLKEIDRLEQQGTITTRDHQLLRSSPIAYDALMSLTLGDEAALTSETVTQMLQRVTNEIRNEDTKMLTTELKAHRATQQQLVASRERNRRTLESIYWQCDREARSIANVITALVGLFLMGDLVASLVLLVLTESVIASMVALPVIAAVGTFTLISRWFGLSVMGVRQRVQHWFLQRCLKQQAVATGIDLSEFSR